MQPRTGIVNAIPPKWPTICVCIVPGSVEASWLTATVSTEFHKEVNIQLQFRLGAIMASQLLQNDKTIEIEKLLLKYLKSPESASGRKALNEARGIAFRAKISYEAFNTLLNTLNRSRI